VSGQVEGMNSSTSVGNGRKNSDALSESTMT
jgi:hypothetical protein